jgi:hypothetical protein
MDTSALRQREASTTAECVDAIYNPCGGPIIDDGCLDEAIEIGGDRHERLAALAL